MHGRPRNRRKAGTNSTADADRSAWSRDLRRAHKAGNTEAVDALIAFGEARGYIEPVREPRDLNEEIRAARLGTGAEIARFRLRPTGEPEASLPSNMSGTSGRSGEALTRTHPDERRTWVTPGSLQNLSESGCPAISGFPETKKEKPMGSSFLVLPLSREADSRFWAAPDCRC